MANIEKIIKAIDSFIDKNIENETTPVDVNPYLEKLGLLNDSNTRKGKPLRDILRKGLIPHAYQVGNRWHIPKSNDTGNNNRYASERDIRSNSNIIKYDVGNKLIPIANLIIDILKDKYSIKTNYILEYKPKWLDSDPQKMLLNKYWDRIKIIYSSLNNNLYDLDQQLIESRQKSIKRKQSYDIWISEPFNFAVEFDEKQHFNQFRKQTLNHYEDIRTNFDLDYYKKLNTVNINPSTSGFTLLRSDDPLFPELLKGERQDNRIRQRAFRDFLKDVTPIAMGNNSTLRIPYYVTNNKINNFNEEDLNNIKEYIHKFNLLNNF